jgi:hypothetical protein
MKYIVAKLVTIAVISILVLSSCTQEGGSLVVSDGALKPQTSEVSIESCWRSELLRQSIINPKSRYNTPQNSPYISSDGTVETETNLGTYPPTLGSPLLVDCITKLGSGAVTLGDIDNDGTVDILGSLGNAWLTDLSSKKFKHTQVPSAQNSFVKNLVTRTDFSSLIIDVNSAPAGGIADLDNDGINEIIIVNPERTSSQPLLFFNYIDSKWLDVTHKFKIEAPVAYRVVSAVGLIDYNRDGFLDIVIGHNSLLRQIEALNHTEETYQLGLTVLKNSSGSGFVDATNKLGIQEVVKGLDLVPIFSDGGPQLLPKVFTLDFGIVDLDNDSWMDIIVIGDFGTTFILWNENGESFSSNKNYVIPSASAMGVAFYDINNDGLMDFVITQIYDEDRIQASCPNSRPCEIKGNIFMVSESPRNYKNYGRESGIFNGAWGWGVVFQDLTNKGIPDILQTSGLLVPVPGGSWKFRKGDFFIFSQLTKSNGENAGLWENFADDYGVSLSKSAGSVVSYDFFNTGLPDIIIGPRTSNSLIYIENRLNPEGNWLMVDPVGNPDTKSSYKSTLQAWGAKIEVFTESDYWWLYAGTQNSSHLSSGITTTRFGVGDNNLVNVRVTFPSGEVRELFDIPANSKVSVRE